MLPTLSGSGPTLQPVDFTCTLRTTTEATPTCTAVHALAGTAPVVALMPVTLMPDSLAALGYLAAFGIGTIVAMGLYSLLAAVAAARAASSVKLARIVAGVTAGASVAVGLWWIARAVSELAA